MLRLDRGPAVVTTAFTREVTAIAIPDRDRSATSVREHVRAAPPLGRWTGPDTDLNVPVDGGWTAH